MSNLNFSVTKIIKENDQTYLYNSENGGIYKIDEEVEAILSCKTLQQVYDLVGDETKADAICKKMKDARVIVDEAMKNDTTDTQAGKITYMILMISQNCNLNCTYCFGDKGTYSNRGFMSFETAKRAVDMFGARQETEFTICFFGGEPLMNVNVMKRIMDYALSVNDKVKFSMTTNGTLINDEIEELIDRYKIYVQISIDGDKDTHDANRKYSAEKGSYCEVKSRTEKLRGKYSVPARATVTPCNLEFYDIADHLVNMNFSNVYLAPAANLMDEQDFINYGKKQLRAFEQYEQMIKEKRYEEVMKVGNFMKLLKRIQTITSKQYSCGAGRNMVAVDIDGKVYPCQRFVGQEEFCLGKMDAGDIYKQQKAFLDQMIISRFEKCSGCWLKNLCMGGCVNENYCLSGNISIPDDKLCTYYQMIYEQMIHIYLRLTDEEKRQLHIVEGGK